jgi:hypothetical protein
MQQERGEINGQDDAYSYTYVRPCLYPHLPRAQNNSPNEHKWNLLDSGTNLKYIYNYTQMPYIELAATHIEK